MEAEQWMDGTWIHVGHGYSMLQLSGNRGSFDGFSHSG